MANILTVFRILLIPVFIPTFAKNPFYGLCIFILACITDVLDGYIARKTDTVTTFGKWADPAADKAMTITVVTVLFISGYVPWYFPLFCIIKESLLIIGSIITYRKERSRFKGAKAIGKAAMVMTFIAVVASFFSDVISPWHLNLIWLSIGFSSASVAYYLRTFLKTPS
jgi:cardiolipin synthase